MRFHLADTYPDIHEHKEKTILFDSSVSTP